MLNLDGKQFRPVQNTENGDLRIDTLFIYHQDGSKIWAEYSGGAIFRGELLGSIDDSDELRFAYQHLTRSGELKAGLCHSKPEHLPDGRLRFHEDWRWTTGDLSHGNSIIEEVL